MTQVRPGQVRKFAFADETFRDPQRAQGVLGYYQLAAVLVEGDDLASVRAEVSAHGGAGGQFKASNLANQNNRQAIADVLDLVCDSPCFNLVVVRNDHSIGQEQARQSCLEGLLTELDGQKIFSLTLDSRHSVVGSDPEVRNKRDLATRRRLISSGTIDRNIRVTHQHDHEEHMLWVPDAVGWAHRRHILLGDSDLWRRVEPVTRVIEL